MTDKKLEAILKERQNTLKAAQESAQAKIDAERAEKQDQAILTATRRVDAEMDAAVATLNHLNSQRNVVIKKVKALSKGLANLSGIAKVDPHLANSCRETLEKVGIDCGKK